MEAGSPVFSTRDVMRLSHLTQRGVQYYSETGLLPNRQVGHSKRFTFNEALSAAVLGEAMPRIAPNGPRPLSRRAWHRTWSNRAGRRYLLVGVDWPPHFRRVFFWLDTDAQVIEAYKEAKSGMHLIDVGAIEIEFHARMGGAR